jgi:thermostable 8-oxoguanine DNA glycosylase
MRRFDFTKQLPTHCSDKYEKEYFLIFSIIVAGRNAKMAVEKTWRLLEFTWGEETPFDLIKHYIDHETLVQKLKSLKIGQYTRIEKALKDIINLDVETCTLEDLLACHGVGNKTSRFFLLNTRKDAEYAVLDTHILKWLQSIWTWKAVPKSTPTSESRYALWENEAIRALKKEYPERTLAQADFEIWKTFAKGLV